MKQQLCRSGACGVCVLALLLLFAPVSYGKTVNKSFDVSTGGTLEVDTDIGSIDVETGGAKAVEIRVESTGPRADELEVTFDHHGNTVSVKGEFPRSSSWFGGRNPRVRFSITVPRRFDVNLRTSGGSISVSDLEGAAEVKTSGGSLKLGSIDGTVSGRTSGGSISVDGCSGEVDVDTSGGSISIGDVNGEIRAHTSGGSITVGRARGSVDVNTSGGSINLKEVGGTVQASTSGGSVTAYISEQPKGDCRLTTSGGGVQVTLARNIAVTISAQASSKVHCDFDLEGRQATKTSLKGRLNGGGPELFLRTSGGGVSILKK